MTCLCSHDCPRVSASAIPWSSHRAGVGGGHTAPPAPWVTVGVEDTGPGPNSVEQKRCAERRVTPGNEESLAGEKRTPGLSLRDPGDHRALTEQGGRATGGSDLGTSPERLGHLEYVIKVKLEAEFWGVYVSGSPLWELISLSPGGAGGETEEGQQETQREGGERETRSREGL